MYLNCVILKFQIVPRTFYVLSSLVQVFEFNQSTYTVDEGDSVPVMVRWVSPQQGEVEVRVTVEALTRTLHSAGPQIWV